MFVINYEKHSYFRTPPPPPTPSAVSFQETDNDYESDFEIDKEGVTKVVIETDEGDEGEEHEEDEQINDEYENDSFIIDDDGGNKDGDLTESDVSAVSVADSISRENSSKVSE